VKDLGSTNTCGYNNITWTHWHTKS